MNALLDIRNLSVSYGKTGTPVQAVRNIDLSISRGEIVALVGESGSGKSTIAKAILGLLAPGALIQGQIALDGTNLHPGKTIELIRGRKIGLVPQYPSTSLNPTMRIGKQIAEAIIKSKGRRDPGLGADVIDLLEQVGIDKPVLRARQFPHQLSGGMCQRVLIAIALAGDPALILADEPTSALDVTVQKRILDHLARLVRERGISLLIITHDLGIAVDRADRLLVMKDGQIMEHGPTDRILAAPAADYTRSLIAAAHQTNGITVARQKDGNDERLVFRMDGVTKIFGRASAKDGHTALSDVSVSVRQGKTLAIVGESGSGKTTALRIALGLETPTAGKIYFNEQEIGKLGWDAMRPLRQHMQLVQQNPFAALDPRFTVRQSIVEPLVSLGLARGAELDAEARRLLDLVHLPQSFLNRRPHELSGGQSQRVTIARALAPGPEIIFLDEPVSALDVSAQKQILKLLCELQAELGVSYVLVSHDLSMVAQIAHDVAVFSAGRIMEQGTTAAVLLAPETLYTRALLAAIPGRRLRSRDKAKPASHDGLHVPDVTIDHAPGIAFA